MTVKDFDALSPREFDMILTDRADYDNFFLQYQRLDLFHMINIQLKQEDKLIDPRELYILPGEQNYKEEKTKEAVSKVTPDLVNAFQKAVRGSQ